MTTGESEKGMSGDLECMCLQCGISHYLAADLLVLEAIDGDHRKGVANHVCTECGGALYVLGRAGDAPFYTAR